MEKARAFLVQWHYLGLFVVILAEEAGIPLPVPGDVFIAAMGFLSHGAARAYLATAAIVTLATVLGASALYLLSRHAGRPFLRRIGGRFGYTETRSARLEAWLARRGAVAVVGGRLVPGLRIVMTVVAGALRLPHGTFAAGTLVAGALWATIYFWIGWALAAGWQRLAGDVSRAWPFLAAAAAAVAFVLWVRVRGRRLARAGHAAPRPKPAAAPDDAAARPDPPSPGAPPEA